MTVLKMSFPLIRKNTFFLSRAFEGFTNFFDTDECKKLVILKMLIKIFLFLLKISTF